MRLCKRTEQTFVSHSIFSCYVVLLITTIALSQIALNEAERTSSELVKNGPLLTSSDARRRRQVTELDTNSSPDIVELNFEDDYVEYPDLEEEIRLCPDECRCNSDVDVVCAFLSLTAIPSNMPPDLTKLSLAYNKLTTLPNNAFAEYSNSLKHLFLQSNHLSQLNGVFENLPNTEVLRLSWNQITTIRKMLFSDLISLKQLYLDNNMISFFHSQALRGLTNLRLLNLEGNRLIQLHPDTFVTLQFHDYFKYDLIFCHISFLFD